MIRKLLITMICLIFIVPSSVFAESEHMGDSEALATETIEENNEEASKSETDETPIINKIPGETEAETAKTTVNQITDLTIKANSLSACTISWNVPKNTEVYIGIRVGYDFVRTKTNKKSYTLSDIPYGETVTFFVTTEPEKEVQRISINPSYERTPIKIEIYEPTYFITNETTDISKYKSSVHVITRDGTRVSNMQYEISSNEEIKTPGIYKGKVTFINAYERFPSMDFEIEIIPHKAKTYCFDYFQTHKCLNLCIFSPHNDFDKVQIEASENENFSNALKKTVKKNKKNEVTWASIYNTKPNTHYYVRTRVIKEYKGNNLYSNWDNAEAYTKKRPPKYYRSQKDVRKILAKTKKNRSFTYVFNGRYSTKAIENLIEKTRKDFKQYVGRYHIKIKNQGQKTVVRFTYDRINGKKYRRLTKEINKIAKKANKKKTKRAKIKYINKAICKKCKYDYAALKRNKKQNSNTHTAYGCLVRGKAVCTGYAEAFHLICVRCGIKDKYVKSEHHIWNKVRLGRKWYHVDTCWNDTTHTTKYLIKKLHK